MNKALIDESLLFEKKETLIIGDELIPKKEKVAPPGKIYLRLTGIYTGDIELKPLVRTECIIFHFKDLSGLEFICPTAISSPIYRDSVLKYLGKLLPIALSEEVFKKIDGEKEDKTSV